MEGIDRNIVDCVCRGIIVTQIDKYLRQVSSLLSALSTIITWFRALIAQWAICSFIRIVHSDWKYFNVLTVRDLQVCDLFLFFRSKYFCRKTCCRKRGTFMVWFLGLPDCSHLGFHYELMALDYLPFLNCRSSKSNKKSNLATQFHFPIS